MTEKNRDFRVVYLGSPAFAVPPLRRLLAEGYNVPLVITQPDRPKGRSRKLQPTDVRVAAEELGLRVMPVENVNEPSVLAEIATLKPDVLVVTAFGQLMKDEILHIAPNGAINIHASLLPEYRGASPIHQAVIDGRSKTGVTVMMIEKKLDAGDMLAKAECDILPEDNTGTLRNRLSDMGAELLMQVLADMQAGTLKPEKQDDSLATYAGKITSEREEIDWSLSAVELHNLVRGLTPDTSAYTFWQDDNAESDNDKNKRLKIWRTSLPENTENIDKDISDALPGQVIRADKQGLLVQTGSGILRLVTVQPPGKGQMDAAAWWRGRRDLQTAGVCFGSR